MLLMSALGHKQTSACPSRIAGKASVIAQGAKQDHGRGATAAEKREDEIVSNGIDRQRRSIKSTA
jgi:hypothetical protein